MLTDWKRENRDSGIHDNNCIVLVLQMLPLALASSKGDINMNHAAQLATMSMIMNPAILNPAINLSSTANNSMAGMTPISSLQHQQLQHQHHQQAQQQQQHQTQQQDMPSLSIAATLSSVPAATASSALSAVLSQQAATGGTGFPSNFSGRLQSSGNEMLNSAAMALSTLSANANGGSGAGHFNSEWNRIRYRTRCMSWCQHTVSYVFVCVSSRRLYRVQWKYLCY